MADFRHPRPNVKQIRFCSLCAVSGVVTPSEFYHATRLDYCTFHYWLVRGRVGSHGYSLEDYVNSSKKFSFWVSLPSKADCERMQKEYDGKWDRPSAELMA
ncbi:MAG: hypothetical protein JRM91_03955 [Nitrososphaerota archaeon]|nr:hypothetical protein [Nitrososphaerota archaeon]